jgi:hypothetical protein
MLSSLHLCAAHSVSAKPYAYMAFMRGHNVSEGCLCQLDMG